MNTQEIKRKLAAIFSADVKGYSRLMAEDEEWTVHTLSAYRKIIKNLVQQYRGRVVDAPGDNVLAEFASVVDAVQCAVETQQVLRAKNALLAENRRMDFRIGINLGDVIEEEKQIYGDGVNIAARVEGLAEAGGICISESAYQQIENKIPLRYDYLGEHEVKNIAKPVRVYRAQIESEAVARKPLEAASKEKMAFPLPDKPSIAVLPFVNMSEDPNQEFFSDGLTEQIITGLSHFPRLFVIAGNSTFAYKGKPVKIQKVAEDLGVRYVLEGSVQKSSDRVRITAQLIDAMTGHHIWSEHYDRELKDIFALQDEITIKIMQAMSVDLTEGEQARHWIKCGTHNLKAFEKHEQGIAFMRRGTSRDNDTARQLFEEDIVLDPNFILAYVALGWTHYLDARFGWSESPAKSLQRAFELAQRALAMEESIDLGHTLLGCCYLLMRQHEKAIAEGERAVALNPNGVMAYSMLAAIVGSSGRWEESVLFAKQSMRLNPFSEPTDYWILGRAYFMTGQYDEAILRLKKAVQISPDFLPAHIFLAACYSSLGRDAEAIAAAKEVLRINPKFSLESHAKTLPYKNEADIEREVTALHKAGLK